MEHTCIQGKDDIDDEELEREPAVESHLELHQDDSDFDLVNGCYNYVL